MSDELAEENPHHKNPFPDMHVFSFIDEASGLFWTGQLKDEAQTLFSKRGIEYRTRKAAEEAWRNYEITRQGQAERELPELVMLVQKVELVEIAREKYQPTPKSVRLTRFAMTHGKHDKLTGFIRGLSERSEGDFMEFKYVIQRAPPKRGTPSMRKGDDIDLSALDRAVVSSRKSARKFVAVRSDADLLYLRMSLGEGFAHSYDLDTGVRS